MTACHYQAVKTVAGNVCTGGAHDALTDYVMTITGRSMIHTRKELDITEQAGQIVKCLENRTIGAEADRYFRLIQRQRVKASFLTLAKW